MPKTLDFKLDNIELSTIEQIIKTSKSSRLVKRATGIHMLHLGHSPYEVGRALSVSAPTIYSWFHRWKVEGLQGLENRPKSGRPAIADQTYLGLWKKRWNRHVSRVSYSIVEELYPVHFEVLSYPYMINYPSRV